MGRDSPTCQLFQSHGHRKREKSGEVHFNVHTYRLNVLLFHKHSLIIIIWPVSKITFFKTRTLLLLLCTLHPQLHPAQSPTKTLSAHYVVATQKQQVTLHLGHNFNQNLVNSLWKLAVMSYSGLKNEKLKVTTQLPVMITFITLQVLSQYLFSKGLKFPYYPGTFIYIVICSTVPCNVKG